MEKLHHSSLVLDLFLEIASLSSQKIFQGFDAANYIHLDTWYFWALGSEANCIPDIILENLKTLFIF